MGLIPFKRSATNIPTITQRSLQQKNIELGMRFMHDKDVQIIPLHVKRVFLEKKGLNQQTIEKVIRLFQENKLNRFRIRQQKMDNKNKQSQSTGGLQIKDNNSKGTQKRVQHNQNNSNSQLQITNQHKKDKVVKKQQTTNKIGNIK